MVIDKHQFERYETYTLVPIISYEHAFHGFVNNPYASGMNGNFVILQHEIYEAWEEKVSKIVIKDETKIRKIITDSKRFIEENKKSLQDFLQEEINDSCVFIKKLDWLNELTIRLYHMYSCFTVELIQTENTLLLKELPEVRMKLSNFVSLIWKSYDKIIDFIVKTRGLSVKQMERMISSEVRDILEGKEIIVDENREFAMTIIDNKVETIVGEKAREVREQLSAQVHVSTKLEEKKNAKQVEGMVACKGRVTGKVVVLKERDHNNFAKILSGKKDYILVTFMTRPEIVPYLKEVKAIVTNEGGITCHAAIVSRELNVPCVVGTKHATDVFEDGDIIEVDAQNGIVKLVE
jgi:phosphoenolpyruvate synthase/pyruvate phosphate dikinase